MAKLFFKQEFVLEVGDKKYTGILNDLTKSQKLAFDKTNKKKKEDAKTLKDLSKKLAKISRKIEVKENLEKWDEIEVLELEKDDVVDELSNLSELLSDPQPIEDMFKKRIEYSVESDDKEAILEAGKDYGYQNVFQTILKDIEETRTKK